MSTTVQSFVLPVRSADPTVMFGESEFTYVDISAVDRDRLEIVSPQVLTPDLAPSRARQVLAAGDVVVSTVRPNLNTVALVPESLDGAIASTGFCVLRPNQERLDKRFLFHWISSEATVRRLVQQATGATYPAVSDKVIKTQPFTPPDLAEQQRIAAILDKADGLRRKRQEAIRLADEFLRAVFIDMFGGLDNASNPQVELADVVKMDAPMVEPTNDEFADMLHVGPDRIEKGNGQLLACETARAEGLTSKKFLFDERYVLYSKIRPALKKCALAEFRGLCSADMYPVRPSGSEVTREFIWGLLLSEAFDRYVSTLPDRANIPKLNRVELNAFQFRLPSIESQRKYSSIVQRTMALKRQHNSFLKQAIALPASFGFFN